MSATLLRVAALTHVGKRRQSNEDCIAVDTHTVSAPMSAPWTDALSLDAPRVCMIADGMGGHPAGDVASRLAIEQLVAELPGALGNDHSIVAALRDANRAMFEAMLRTPAVAGMGTTIAGIGILDQSVVIFNVGDTRVYRVRERSVQQVSIDDSEEVMSSLLGFNFPSRALSQCLGGFPSPDALAPHLLREEVAVGRSYLLCSDGLHDMLSDAEIFGCMRPDLAASVRAMFDAAMDAGGIDNISIILARIENAPAA